jgi:hypothetical protein
MINKLRVRFLIFINTKIHFQVVSKYFSEIVSKTKVLYRNLVNFNIKLLLNLTCSDFFFII